MPITTEYLTNLPEIYRDILAAYPRFNAPRRAGDGLSYQSLYSALEGKYQLGQIRQACEQMARGGAMEIRHEIFACPTRLGEDLITAITGQEAPALTVPPFVPPTD